MDLMNYIKNIITCSDEIVEFEKANFCTKLTAEYGIYDNYPILLSGNVDEILEYMINSKKYEKNTLNSLIYIPQRVHLDFRELNSNSLMPEFKDYNFSFTLHHYYVQGDIKMRIRAIADCVKDIGGMMIERKISGCFPNSVGWSYLNQKNRKILCFKHPNSKP